MSRVRETTCPDPELHGELTIRVIAMPQDTNPNGDMFGGWVVSQMDLAGLSIARRAAKCRITTVAIDGMSFINPVFVGDALCCYAKLIKIGTTSMQIKISAWAVREDTEERHHVTEGLFTYVAIDEHGRPQPVVRHQ